MNLGTADCQKPALFTDEIESQVPGLRSEAVQCIYSGVKQHCKQRMKTCTGLGVFNMFWLEVRPKVDRANRC